MLAYFAAASRDQTEKQSYKVVFELHLFDIHDDDKDFGRYSQRDAYAPDTSIV